MSDVESPIPVPMQDDMPPLARAQTRSYKDCIGGQVPRKFARQGPQFEEDVQVMHAHKAKCLGMSEEDAARGRENLAMIQQACYVDGRDHGVELNNTHWSGGIREFAI